jgi:hypothetical protein
MPKAKQRKRPEVRKNPQRVKNLMKRYRKVSDTPHTKQRHTGRCTKLGLFSFMSQIFTNNESVPRDQKLTNDAIELMMIDEFPDHKAMIMGFKTKTRTINYYRDLYNRGVMTNRVPPPVISYRYNQDGFVVDLRHGAKLLSTEEKRRYAQKFFGLHAVLKSRRKYAQEDHSHDIDQDPSPESES